MNPLPDPEHELAERYLRGDLTAEEVAAGAMIAITEVSSSPVRWLSSGIPKSARIALRTPLAAGSCMSIPTVPLGSALSSLASIRMVICGA